MNEKRREILLGYLLSALDRYEEAKVERELAVNESLQNDLAELYEEISPILMTIEHHPVPQELAKKTCRNLWDKIDAAPKSETKPLGGELSGEFLSQAFNVQAITPKKRKASIVFHQPPETSPTPTHAEDKKIEKAPVGEKAIVTEQPTPKKSTRKSLESVLLAEPPSMIIKKEQPRYYGHAAHRNGRKKQPWKKRDVVASMLVGLTAAVLIFPLFQLGWNNVISAIVQKRVAEIGQNISTHSVTHSSYGLSPNDLMAVTNMNLDGHSAALLHNHRNNTITRTTYSPNQIAVASDQEKLNLQYSLRMSPVSQTYPISRLHGANSLNMQQPLEILNVFRPIIFERSFNGEGDNVFSAPDQPTESNPFEAVLTYAPSLQTSIMSAQEPPEHAFSATFNETYLPVWQHPNHCEAESKQF